MSSVVLTAYLLIACPSDDKPAGEKPVSVTVVIILATDKHTKVDPKLQELAAEVRKREEKLTGYKLVATECKSIPVGDTITINLTDKQTMKVTVNRAKDEKGRITLTLEPPSMDTVNYACTCDKFFPIVTPHRTKTGEQLIIAVMAKPCTRK